MDTKNVPFSGKDGKTFATHSILLDRERSKRGKNIAESTQTLLKRLNQHDLLCWIPLSILIHPDMSRGLTVHVY